MQPPEPVWCAMCADRPMVGHMIVMLDGTTEQIGEITLDEGAVCDLCGRSWTGAVIAESGDDGRAAVLQYLHPDFEKLTESQIKEFAAEHICSQCGDPTDELPLWVAERVLKASPHLAMADEIDAICEKCAKNFAEAEGLSWPVDEEDGGGEEEGEGEIEDSDGD